MKFFPVYILISLFLFACDEEEAVSSVDPESIIGQLTNDFEQLPEGRISQSADSTVFAQYVNPTNKYGHGILGDKTEAEGLVVVVDQVFYEFQLDEDQVFEDIRPRLFDVDGDGALEFITLRTNVAKGGGIAIYKIINGQLIEYASVTEIGIPNRWLNIVAIDDLDNDGTIELVWIETPHIGGTLKVAKINEGVLQVLDETREYSNHVIGERNLCLSVLTEQFGQKVFYVPNQSRDKVIGFTFENNSLTIFEEIDLSVDFSQTLISQFDFPNASVDEVNCIEGQ